MIEFALYKFVTLFANTDRFLVSPGLHLQMAKIKVRYTMN